MKILTLFKLDNSILGVIIIPKVSIKKPDFLSICNKFSKSTQLFADYTIGLIGGIY